MRLSDLREAHDRRDPMFGTFSFFADPAAVEMAAYAGLDYVIIDAEHSARSIADIADLVRGADAAGISPIVRVGSTNANYILRVLESGAQGIVVPHIDTAQDAKEVVSAVRYPPAGNRGAFSVSRAARYGSISFATHVDVSNRDVLSIGLIESPIGVSNIGSILDEGLDVIVLGRGDLSCAMGLAGQPHHPAVREATEEVAAAVHAREDVALGAILYGVDEAEWWLSFGCRYFIYQTDFTILLAGYRRGQDELRSAVDASLRATLAGTPAAKGLSEQQKP